MEGRIGASLAVIRASQADIKATLDVVAQTQKQMQEEACKARIKTPSECLPLGTRRYSHAVDVGPDSSPIAPFVPFAPVRAELHVGSSLFHLIVSPGIIGEVLLKARQARQFKVLG